MHKKNLGAADTAQKGVSEEGESMCSFLDIWESDNRFGSRLSRGQWEEGTETLPLRGLYSPTGEGWFSVGSSSESTLS